MTLQSFFNGSKKNTVYPSGREEGGHRRAHSVKLLALGVLTFATVSLADAQNKDTRAALQEFSSSPRQAAEWVESAVSPATRNLEIPADEFQAPPGWDKSTRSVDYLNKHKLITAPQAERLNAFAGIVRTMDVDALEGVPLQQLEQDLKAADKGFRSYEKFRRASERDLSSYEKKRVREGINGMKKAVKAAQSFQKGGDPVYLLRTFHETDRKLKGHSWGPPENFEKQAKALLDKKHGCDFSFDAAGLGAYREPLEFLNEAGVLSGEEAQGLKMVHNSVRNLSTKKLENVDTEFLGDFLRDVNTRYKDYLKVSTLSENYVGKRNTEAGRAFIKGMRQANRTIRDYQKNHDKPALLQGFLTAQRQMSGSREGYRTMVHNVKKARRFHESFDNFKSTVENGGARDVQIRWLGKAAEAEQGFLKGGLNQKLSHTNALMHKKYGQGLSKKGYRTLREFFKNTQDEMREYNKYARRWSRGR